MSCSVIFNGKSFTLKEFEKLLNTGVLYNLVDRKVVSVPDNIRSQLVNGHESRGKNWSTHNIFVENKKDIEDAMVNTFGLKSDEAKAVAEIYDLNATAWANRNNRLRADYFKTLTIVKSTATQLKTVQPVLYSREDVVNIEKEKQAIREKTEKFGKFMKAPNGKDTNLTEDQWLTVQTKAFKEWFGKSKVLDENGEPKVMYHGSPNPEFEVFDPHYSKRNAGLFVTPSEMFANDYVGDDIYTGGKPTVIELFVKANNVFDFDNATHLELLKKEVSQAHTELMANVIDSDEDVVETNEDNNWITMERDDVQKFIKKNGFDGYYIKEMGIKNLAVFKPNQLKVSDGRNQSFLHDNPSILFQSQINSPVVERVVSGFQLERDPKGFGVAFKSKNQKASPALASAINSFINNTLGVDTVKFVYEKTYGTVNAVPVQSSSTLFQGDTEAKAAILLGQDGNDIIYALSNPNVSSPIHELAHKWERELREDEKETVLDWTKQNEWNTETSEKFARGFENYLATQEAPNIALKNLFEQFKNWLKNIYKGIVGSEIDLELNDQMKTIYAQMLGQNYKKAILNEEGVETVSAPVIKVDTLTSRIEQYEANTKTRITSPLSKFDNHNKYVIQSEMEDAYREGTYDELVQSGELTDVAYLRSVFISVGLPEFYADNIFRRVQNPTVKTSIANVTEPTTSPVVAKVVDNLVQNGQIEFALQNDVVTPEIIEQVLANTQTSDAEKEALKEKAKEKAEEIKEATIVLEQKVEEEKREYIQADVEVVSGEEIVPETSEQVVEEPIEDTREGLPKEEPKLNRKYDVGDPVIFRGEKAIVKGYDEDGFVELTDDEGGFKPAAREKDLSAFVQEAVIPQSRFVQDKENPSISFEPVSQGYSKQERDELIDKQNKLIRVASRISKVLPSVKVQIGTFGGKWKGRIVGNTVQIDYVNAGLETPIHELMHPFVLAVRLGNPELYQNLIQELKFGQNSYYLDLINEDEDYANISENEKEDEALVRYISDEVVQLFDEHGQIDEAVLDKKQASFVKFIYDWFLDKLRDIWGLVNDKITKTLSGEDKKSSAGRKGLSFKQFDKISYDKSTKTLKGYKPGSNRPSFTLDSFDFNDTTLLETRDFPKAVLSQMQAMIEGSSEKLVELNPNDIIVEDVEDKDISYYNTHDENYSITVADIPANFTLQNLSDFIAAQTKLSINLAGQQQAIDKMEAYQYSTKVDADEILKKVERKMKQLEDTGKRRIMNSEYVTNDVIGIRRILRDFEGVEAVSEYVRFGIGGIENAANLIRDIRERLDMYNKGYAETFENGKKEFVKVAEGSILDEQKVNTLNRDLQEAIALVTFYDDLGSLKYYFADAFEKGEVDDFVRTLEYANMRKGQISSIANDLVTEWLYPKLQESQASLAPELQITKEQFKRKIRFADQNNSNISYWMGAAINSRDPLNAITAVKVKDILNEDHIKEAERLNDVRRVYNEFLKRTGTKNTVGNLEKYYKDNFLRKAKIWEVINIDDKGEKTYGYVERWAFHEKYYWDLFEDDLRKFKENLPKAKSDEDFVNNDARIGDWVNANHPEKSTRYLNKDYVAISQDPYFNLLYSTYQEGNEKYGERALQFGIVPQAYKKKPLLIEKWKDIKSLPDYIKGLKDTKGRTDKAGKITKDLGDYFFDDDNWSKEQDLNLDGTHYSGIKSPFTHLIAQDDIDFRLNESVYGFYTTANTFSSLRQVQANVENLKLMINGNVKLGIEARKLLKMDKDGVVFDRFKGVPVNDDKGAVKLVKQLDSFINDVFYGEGEFESSFNIGPVKVNANQLGTNLGFVTALYNMAGNVIGAVSNSAVGNVQSLGEAVGAKYYNPKNWLNAKGTYYKSFANGSFLNDVTNPVKSKITQLAIVYDAIQGEFRDKFGKNITGNVAQRYATGDSFFILNHIAEHEIQLTGFLALADATKVKLKDGKEITLYEAYTKNDKGFYKLREDAIWSQKDNDDFIKKLHGISKDLNGNYAAFDKSMAQRYWMGKLAIQYRKYLYPAWRARFAKERVDYERGEVLKGYYRTFFGKVIDDIKNYRFPLANKKEWTTEEGYAVRKTLFDLGIIIGTYFVIMGLTSAKMPDDDAEKRAKQRLILAFLRLNSDISQYSITAPQEGIKTIMNPAASLQTLKNYLDFLGQLFTAPNEAYKSDGSGYKAGDTKLGHKFEKLIPLYRQYMRFMSPDEQIKYFSLINKDIQADNPTK